MENINLGSRKIGIYEKPFFIGEVGINHNGDIEIAKKLIDMAVHVGIDAVKFQKRDYRNTITKKQLEMDYLHSNSFGKTYLEHKIALEFTDTQLIELHDYSKKKEIDFCCSAFDINSYDFIENELKPLFHKIASPLTVNHDLLIHVAKYGKPVFLSTGMSSFDEIAKAVELIKPINPNLVLLQCTSLYPTEYDEVNLRVLEQFREMFDVLVGFSSHDKSVVLPAVATAFGACVFEKHITLDRTMKGPDHSSSFEERGLELSYKYAINAQKALGLNKKKILERELSNRNKHMQSIVAKDNIKKGDIISREKLTFKSPGTGLLPYEIGSILNRKAKKDFITDEQITTNNVE